MLNYQTHWPWNPSGQYWLVIRKQTLFFFKCWILQLGFFLIKVKRVEYLRDHVRYIRKGNAHLSWMHDNGEKNGAEQAECSRSCGPWKTAVPSKLMRKSLHQQLWIYFKFQLFSFLSGGREQGSPRQCYSQLYLVNHADDLLSAQWCDSHTCPQCWGQSYIQWPVGGAEKGWTRQCSVGIKLWSLPDYRVISLPHYYLFQWFLHLDVSLNFLSFCREKILLLKTLTS